MKRLFILLALFNYGAQLFGQNYKLFSPNGKNEIEIKTNPSLSLQLIVNSKKILNIEDIFIELQENTKLGYNQIIANSEKTSVTSEIKPSVKEKFSTIIEEYNQLKVDFTEDFSFIVRAYNDGIAYRFLTNLQDSITVKMENLRISLAEDDSIYYQKSESFNSSYETPYQYSPIRDIDTNDLCCLPLLVNKANGIKVLVTESSLLNFPGLWLKRSGENSFKSTHPRYPIEFINDSNPYGNGQVKNHADYISKSKGDREYPWRLFVISEDDAGLIENTLVYQLANSSKLNDVSWITPGVVTFDWWGRRNIYGTDFKAGINTETAKYFIDFAAEFGFEYFLFDDGWSNQDDLFAVHPDLDMPEVLEHAKTKEVKIMLWVIWNTFEKQKEAAWKQFVDWGISGIKFDFMNRDDQKMVDFYYEIAEEAAERKMVIDFHGAFKPTGLRRTYPNVLTREALIEFEYNGWTDFVTPEHDNLLPYIRMVTGPMDYIPFTTNNAQKKNFRPVGDMPMGQGTRAHSMALFVIMESPMQMLPDSPSDYYRERECTEFISTIPTEWDDLKVLEAKIGDYTVIARRNGDNWYIGGITDWTAREFEIYFDFLSDGTYTMELIEDGINADIRAIDYNTKTVNISKYDKYEIKLAPGGGWIAKLLK